MSLTTVKHNPDVLSCLANLSSDEVFTPPKLVNDMLDMLPKELWNNPNAKFLDPATKTGVFLREIFKRLLEGLEGIYPDLQDRVNHICNNQLYGIAITELTALLSRRAIYCSKNANGKYSICTNFDDEEGNIIFPKVNHEWKNGSCTFCGATQDIYERTDELETHAYGFIHDVNEKELNTMQWDVIIGNPPYQLSDGGAGASAKPLYHKFIEQAKKLNPSYISMIVPSRWFAGGKGLDEFRSTMLNDRRIKKIVDYPNAKECFPSNNISGGVCYFLWSRDYDGDCEFSNIINGEEFKAMRKLNEFDIFVRYNDALSIIHKVTSKKEEMLSSIISSRKPFGFNSYDRGEEKSPENNVALHSSVGIGYVRESQVLQGKDLIPLYKVIIGKALSGHIGETDKDGMVKVLATVRKLLPNEVCTETYLVVGGYKTEQEAENLEIYLKTKFVRFLLLQALTSMNITKDKFRFVPLQDFTKTWDDECLYEKYKLTKKEIDFIEGMIRPFDGVGGDSDE